MSEWAARATVALAQRVAERVPLLRVDLVQSGDPGMPEVCVLVRNFPPPMPDGPQGEVLAWYRDNDTCVTREYLFLPDTGSRIPGDDRIVASAGFSSKGANRLLRGLTDPDPVSEVLGLLDVLQEQAQLQLESISESLRDLELKYADDVIAPHRAYRDELAKWVGWLAQSRGAEFPAASFPIWTALLDAGDEPPG